MWPQFCSFEIKAPETLGGSRSDWTLKLQNSKNHCSKLQTPKIIVTFYSGQSTRDKGHLVQQESPLRRCTWQSSRVPIPAGCVFIFYLEIKGRKNTAENIKGINSFTWFKKKKILRVPMDLLSANLPGCVTSSLTVGIIYTNFS